VTVEKSFLFTASPLSTAMDMSQKDAFENRILGMSNGRQASLFRYREVADLIHFTEGRFSNQPGIHRLNEPQLGRWWGAQLF
jgi:hypothetical protein